MHEGKSFDFNPSCNFVSFVVTRFYFQPVPLYKSLDAVFQMDNIEVYKQSDGFTTELEVRKNLGVMDGRDGFDRMKTKPTPTRSSPRASCGPVEQCYASESDDGVQVE